MRNVTRMLDYNNLPDIMYFGASKQYKELKGRVFLTPHIGIVSIFIIEVDDFFAQFPKGYNYNCNISYCQWNYSNDLLKEPLKVVNAFHNIPEFENQIFKGQSSGYIHEVNISKVKDMLSLFVTENPDRELIYHGEEPLMIMECISHTLSWDFTFSEEEVKKYGAGDKVKG